MPVDEFVYDASNEAIVLRTAIAYACAGDEQARKDFRAIVHSIGADEFLVGQHCSLWRVLRRISDGALTYTPELARQLTSTESTPVEESYLEELENTSEVADNLAWHVQTLRWDATRARVMKEALPDLTADLKDPRVTVERAVTSARAVVRALEGGGGRRFIHRPEENRSVYSSELRKRRSEGNVWTCGVEAMDLRLTEGFMPSKTCIITGLSGSGKSTFAAKLAIHLARLGRRPLVCAWEMGATSTMDVLAAMLTNISLNTIVKGTYTDAEHSRLEKANAWINSKIRFMENAFFERVAEDSRTRFKRSNHRNLDILEGYIAESGCDEIIMDLWDRLLEDQSPEGVTNALYRQQNMCVEYNVHGTLLVQLKLKDVEKRADKRPTREAIKGVGAFVEVADLIFGVHRDSQFKAVPDNTLEVICLKQRKGASNWAVRFDWSGEHCQINGGVEVPYNPGLEEVAESEEIGDPSAIRTRPRKTRINRRD